MTTTVVKTAATVTATATAAKTTITVTTEATAATTTTATTSAKTTTKAITGETTTAAAGTTATLKRLIEQPSNLFSGSNLKPVVSRELPMAGLIRTKAA